MVAIPFKVMWKIEATAKATVTMITITTATTITTYRITILYMSSKNTIELSTLYCHNQTNHLYCIELLNERNRWILHASKGGT